jgi:hypothetical protein
MGFPYNRVTDAITSVLSTANTTTSATYLSTDLSSKVQLIQDDDYDTINIGVLKLPAVFVRTQTKDSEFASLGETGPLGHKRKGTVIFEVVGIMRKEGILSTRRSLARDVNNFARNIESVFENNITLSGTVLWCDPTKTQFSVPVADGSTIFKACMIQLNATTLYR